MENKGKTAKELFKKGYNCSQAVFGAFAEDFGIDFDLAVKLASGFGGGIGRMRETCGAFCGMVMVLDMAQGIDMPNDKNEKALLYKKVQYLAERFKEKNGSTICKELLSKKIGTADSSPNPEERTAEYYKKRPCTEIVEIAANIIQEYLENDKSEK